MAGTDSDDARSDRPADPHLASLDRLGIVAALLPGLIVLLFEVIRHEFLESILPTGVGNLAAAALTLSVGFVLIQLIFRSVKRIQCAAVERNAEIAALRAAVDERERLSRDLHDSSAQLFSFLLIKADTVAQLLDEGSPDAARRELEKLRRHAEETSADVRDVIAGLRLRPGSTAFVESLRELCARFEEVYAIRTNVTVQGGLGEPPAETQLELFGIVQEALMNVRRHASATDLDVSLGRCGERELALRIRDNGTGIAGGDLRLVRRGYGLTMMRERAARIGGTIEIVSAPGGGTSVDLRVPLVAR